MDLFDTQTLASITANLIQTTAREVATLATTPASTIPETVSSTPEALISSVKLDDISGNGYNDDSLVVAQELRELGNISTSLQVKTYIIEICS